MERLGVVIAGLCTMALAVGAAILIGRVGDQSAAAFIVGLAILVVGGFLAGAVIHPKLVDLCVVAAVLTVAAGMSWSPSGEAGPGERSMDWRAVGSVVLEGCLPVALWGLALFGAEYVRRDHGNRA
jgi:disulfide bond formation protein DsbB